MAPLKDIGLLSLPNHGAIHFHVGESECNAASSLFGGRFEQHQAECTDELFIKSPGGRPLVVRTSSLSTMLAELTTFLSLSQVRLCVLIVCQDLYPNMHQPAAFGAVSHG